MNSKLRILTFHHIPNNGAFIFAHTLLGLWQNEYPQSDVKILDYKSIRLAMFEYFKRFKIIPGAPLFYLERSRMWDDFLHNHLEMDADFPHWGGEKKAQTYFSNHYVAVIVGMDVWCIVNGTERPRFPNIYWLPEKMDIPKIAYGVSGYNSDRSLIRNYADDIRRYVDDFDVIGSRDRFTHELVLEHRKRLDGLVEITPDPAFLYEIKDAGAARKLKEAGVDLNRPILGLLLYGEDELSRAIRAHYRSRGYQIVALSMFNPAADFNMGHILNPFEWAETFRFFSFCITDRFHGSIFCLKNGTPFISLEKEQYLPIDQSKLYDLLGQFQMTECYRNSADEDFNILEFLSDADQIEAHWKTSFLPGIEPVIRTLQDRHHELMGMIRSNYLLGN